MRKGDYCIRSIDKLVCEGCISLERAAELKKWQEYRKEHPEISGLSEGACKLLMREKDPVIRIKAIESVTNSIKHGHIKTGKQVARSLKNIKAGKNNRGGDHTGASKVEDRREGFNNLLLTAIRSGEIEHHITDNVVMGIPEEVHIKLSGYGREEHREKVLNWLQEQANKYNIVLSFLENAKNITEEKRRRK